MKINWLRIAGNAGTAFFTVLASAAAVGVGDGPAFQASLFGAAVQAGLSFFKDLRDADAGVRPLKNPPTLTVF